MKIIGYHNTESDNVKDIITNGFKYRKNEKHWLGQGIYFFDNLDMAFRNIDMLDHEKDIKTIVAEINVTDSEFLNLDEVKNLNEFRKFCSQLYQKMEKEGIELVIKGKSKNVALLTYRCFFLDLFKEEKGYKVVSKTFAKDNPQYAEKVIGFEKYFGLPFLETYICVSGNEYIINKEVIEREWLV